MTLEQLAVCVEDVTRQNALLVLAVRDVADWYERTCGRLKHNDFAKGCILLAHDRAARDDEFGVRVLLGLVVAMIVGLDGEEN